MKTTPCLLAVLTLHTWCFAGVRVFLGGAAGLPMLSTVDAALQRKDASSSDMIPDSNHTEITSTVILLLLQQKCQEWLQKGVTPLPSFCLDVVRPAALTAAQLEGYYQQYAAAASPEEQQRDLRVALYSDNPVTGGMLA